MTKSTTQEERWRGRAWLTAILAAAAWVLLFAQSADAQTIQVPDVVLAQVLGPEALDARAAREVEAPEIERVAHRMQQHFEDQLVAGVTRPSVELEVHFDFDSAEIHTESHAQIEAAATVLTNHFPATRFRVAGYTDDAGEAAYNQWLSERRAEAVYQMLVDEYGVEAERLERVGFGEEGEGDASDAQRRRVELQILRARMTGA